MPKVLIYNAATTVFIFLFYGTDFFENRAHVHVGKKGSEKLAKIWLEPEIEVADAGSLTTNQINKILQIIQENKEMLLKQWKNFITGKKVNLIKQ